MARSTPAHSCTVGDTHTGLRNGFGIENDRTKNWRFEGFWKEDKKHGEGFMYKHGVVYWQKYEEGLLKTEKKVSNMTI